MPVRRKAPTKVVVFQWPSGTPDRQRSQRGARPRSLAIFAEKPVSSMNARRAGSGSSWPSNQARRRLKTAGWSCSSACAVFLNVQSASGARRSTPNAPGAAPLDSQALYHLVQRDVLAVLDHCLDERGMGVQTRASSFTPRLCRTLTKPGACHPSHRRSRADPKPDRSSPSRRPLHLFQNTLTQIVTVGLSLRQPPRKTEWESQTPARLNARRIRSRGRERSYEGVVGRGDARRRRAAELDRKKW